MQLSRPVWAQRRAEEPVAEETPEIGPIEQALMEPSTLVVKDGCVMDGQLITDRPIVVLGDVRGTIACTATVCIADGGSVQGDIEARSVFIQGAVVGNVNGRREVQLYATGKLHGNVVTSSFELHRGAFFDGHTKMLRPQDTGWRRVEATDV
jgi:cytoskeletal protein CcmA (bactofilin family)